MRILPEGSLTILVGLALGAAANFGHKLTTNQLPSWLQVLGYIMQLGLIGVLVMLTVENVGIDTEKGRLATAAVFAAVAQEIITWIKTEGWREVLRVLLRIPPPPPSGKE